MDAELPGLCYPSSDDEDYDGPSLGERRARWEDPIDRFCTVPQKRRRKETGPRAARYDASFAAHLFSTLFLSPLLSLSLSLSLLLCRLLYGAATI